MNEGRRACTDPAPRRLRRQSQALARQFALLGESTVLRGHAVQAVAGASEAGNRRSARQRPATEQWPGALMCTEHSNGVPRKGPRAPCFIGWRGASCRVKGACRLAHGSAPMRKTIHRVQASQVHVAMPPCSAVKFMAHGCCLRVRGRERLPPNICIDRSAEQLRCSVPSALRASAPGHAGRWATREMSAGAPS